MQNPIYGGISADGSILISETKPVKGPVLLATNATTMPDGQFGVKFQSSGGLIKWGGKYNGYDKRN